MFKKYLITLISIFILLLFSYTYIKGNILKSEKTSLSVNLKKIELIEINNKVLSKEFIQYLSVLNNLKIISFTKEYHSLFGLSETKADKIKILYKDGSSDNIYTGELDNDGTKVYIRHENSDTVYESDKLLLNIINEKQDALKEYSLMNSISLNSVIAVKIISNLMDIYVIKDSEGVWIDQNSGYRINRLKIQNLINRILNLRAALYNDYINNLELTQLIKIETSIGQSIILKLNHDKNNNYFIEDENGLVYFLDNKKMDFMENDLTKLQ